MSSNASSHFFLADHEHHQTQRLSAPIQEGLCERWKVSLSKHLFNWNCYFFSSQLLEWEQSTNVKTKVKHCKAAGKGGEGLESVTGPDCWHKVSSE